ncbi:Borealin N terminal-domain-containing protein [Cercophora scortea]|uniref:Borealin N terminal-domain-containing protein n=1 Tax=Cercophora scortea TaxID=314031 RepID=A0AAE0MMZ6_9PEZI|nr:Borealin N terminal-domain-containing protein [Cercophora scortea]
MLSFFHCLLRLPNQTLTIHVTPHPQSNLSLQDTYSTINIPHKCSIKDVAPLGPKQTSATIPRDFLSSTSNLTSPSITMPATYGTKRKSDDLTASNEEHDTATMAAQKVPTKTGSPSAAAHSSSPLKKRKTDITVAQKQALIDNLQLEITERARKLRANYNIHAQSLRTRIEIRVNRIPLSLRKAKMGDLLQKYSTSEQHQNAAAAPAHHVRGPPVPEKDSSTATARQPFPRAPVGAASDSPARQHKRMSREISGGDKENEVDHIENPKKKARAGPVAEMSSRPQGQILSPTSSNSRIVPQGRTAVTPGKSGIARPVSPMKPAAAGAATGMINSMVEKARSTRAAATTTTTTTTRKATTSSATGTTKAKKAAAAAGGPPSRPATRTARRVSDTSESSDGSTSTVVRKRPGTAMSTASSKSAKSAAAAPAAAAKRTVMGTIRKGVAASTTKKAPAPKSAPASTTGTGRVLRKRAAA